MCTIVAVATLGVGTPAAVAIGFGAIGVATAQVATNRQTESDEIDLAVLASGGSFGLVYGWGVYPMYSRIAVIGETQERVDAYVAMYGGETMRKLPMEMPKAQKEAENLAWINQKMDMGYVIIDIGPDPRKLWPVATGDYYMLEVDALAKRGYWGWKPIWKG